VNNLVNIFSHAKVNSRKSKKIIANAVVLKLNIIAKKWVPVGICFLSIASFCVKIFFVRIKILIKVISSLSD